MKSNKKGAGATNTYSLSKSNRTLTPVVSPTIAEDGRQTTPSSHQKHLGCGGHRSILRGVDTFQLTAGGAQFPSVWLLEQQQVWKEYQEQYDYSVPEYLEVEVGNNWFQLFPSGDMPYKYKLYNKQIGMIKVWNTDKWSGGVNGKQHIFLDFRSSYLHQFTREELKVVIKDWVKLFFADIQGVDIQVSRGDIFSDIISDRMLVLEEVEQSISRCKVSQIFKDNIVEFSEQEKELLSSVCNKGEQKLTLQMTPELLEKISLMIENQIAIGTDRIVGNTGGIQTAYWGNHLGGNVWGKVYDKTLKVKKDCDTDTQDLWKLNGWKTDQKVIRTEFSMRRRFLKELNGGSFIQFEEFLDNIEVLWEYFTTKWLRLVVEKKINNIQTSVNTVFWNCVVNSFSSGDIKVKRGKTFNGKINQLFKQGIGCLTTMIGYGMYNNEDISYIRSVVSAVDNVIQQAYEDTSILHRRRKLGLS